MVKKAIRVPRWKKNSGIASAPSRARRRFSTEPGKKAKGMAERTIRVLPAFYIEQLEEFRTEYAAFLRTVELWAKSILKYLESDGVTDHPTLWRLAPVNGFERVKSFENARGAGPTPATRMD
jgi:hypothetical protein